MVALGSNALRFRIGARLRALGFSLPPVVHPTAFLAPSSRVADGAVVMARAVLGTDTSVSSLAIVNTGAILATTTSWAKPRMLRPGAPWPGTSRWVSAHSSGWVVRSALAFASGQARWSARARPWWQM